LNRKDWIRTVLTAVLLTLAFAPCPFGFLSAVALVPFLNVLEEKKPFDAFRAGYVLGFLWSAGTLYWIGWPTVGGLAGALLILSLQPAVFALCLSEGIRRRGRNAVWAAPFIWVALEVAGSHGQLACPWNLLGNTLSAYPLMIQHASVTGVYGVSFFILMLNVFFYFIISRRSSVRKKMVHACAAAILVSAAAAYSVTEWRVPPRLAVNRTIRVGLVQGNIDAYKKWTPSFIDSNFTIYGRMTVRGAKQDPELIVWPETATPCYLRHQTVTWRWLQSMVDSLSIPVLTGSPDYAWSGGEKIKTYNAAFLFEPRSQGVQVYYKKHLVPLSEKVPFVEQVPKLGEWINRLVPETGDYSAGDSTTVFSLSGEGRNKAAFSTVICFESIFPELVSRFVNRGAEFIVVITNDGWFGNTSGPRQHASIAVLRAVENRRWVARCANTGISEFIDPFGRTVQKSRWNEAVVLTQTISLSDEKSFYTRHASSVSFLFSGAGLLVLCVFFIPKNSANGSRKKRSRSGS
jgi:apolipoprotein N-acyltransferase